MARSTVHYTDDKTNNILKALHNKLRPAGTPVQRVEYIIELLLLRIFEVKLKQDKEFGPLRKLFEGNNYRLLFSHLLSLNGKQAISELNKNIFPYYSNILTKAREVFKKNLPQKVQDQLVLIEEVFFNSNFTNNVKTGNLSEIISLVNDIDEARILKTDLLGDAIESALSEQGGTKDVGLYRTPDHIRQMMVTMVDPNFKDVIFDPACGTGGFLFDCFQCVLEKVSKDGKWPSEKAHQEIKKYLDNYLKNIDAEMPSSGIANSFYRIGISGIEYLGMIRKMAAINLYIRGLNPQNIEQGDSLDMFDAGVDAGTKSVVIANPPFGAKLDQDAYPNVWEEYPKTDSTTLFVKLMFNHLKKNGRCAVVVSEGFLTWDNEPAKEMRKMLLNEANLRAIVSLPQGVFVSKGGQGAKTSILYFEKDGPTDWIWHYKITNDGYSMGVNRKEIPDCQIPELLRLFTQYVKQGKTPPETKNSFVIPADWVKTIDPRIIGRVKNETQKEFQKKSGFQRESFLKQLKEKLNKRKINKKEYQEKLWQFDNIWENKTQNVISKRIEKSNDYSFNLQNYRSNLSDEQIKDWQETLKGIDAKNGSTIEKKYQELEKADPKTALQILASFNSKNALQMDIVREYLSKLDKKVLDQNAKLRKFDEILRKGFQYPMVALKNLIVVNGEKIRPLDFSETQFTVLGVSNQAGIFVNKRLKGEDIKQAYFKVHKNQFCYNPYRINVGSIGFCELYIENQIISGAYNVFGCNENELNPKYLNALLNTKKFLDYVNEKASGGVRMNFKIKYMQDWQIPLPPLEVQNEIVEKIEKHKQIIDGAERIVAGFAPVFDFKSYPKEQLDKLSIKITQGPNPKYDGKESENYQVLKTKDLYDDAIYYDQADKISQKVFLENKNSELVDGDVLIAIVGQGSIGKVNIFREKKNKHYIFTRALGLIRVNEKRLIPDYLKYYLLSFEGKNEVNNGIDGTTGQLVLKTSFLKNLEIPLPPPDTQRQIVKKLDRQMQALEGLRFLKSEAEKRIEEILEIVCVDN